MPDPELILIPGPSEADRIRAMCCCKSDDAATCLALRCGPSLDWHGRQEECSCRCHDELAELYEYDEDGA